MTNLTNEDRDILNKREAELEAQYELASEAIAEAYAAREAIFAKLDAVRDELFGE